MRIGFFPDSPGQNPSNTPISKKIDKLKKQNFRLFKLVKDTLKKLEEAEKLQPFQDRGYAKPLGDSIWEFRIPPNSTNGVVRLYFCFNPNRNNYIVVLEMEYKKGKNKADQNLLNSARKKYRGLL